MHKLIKKIIFNVLDEMGYKFSIDDIEVGMPPKKLGDFSSNIWLKHKEIDSVKLIEGLTKSPIIEKVDFIKGFINIYITSVKLALAEVSINKVRLLDPYTATRIKNIYNRLESENYRCTTSAYSNSHYIQIVKAYNYLIEYIHIFDDIEYELIDAIFQAFKILDENIVYRKLRASELSEIKELFSRITLLIERVTYE